MVGALAAAAVGAVWPAVPWPLAPVLAGLATVAGGTCWGAIPGWLRARRGSHEVINTIMLNFVAAGLTSYVALHVLRNPDSQNPETRPVAASYLVQQFAVFQGAPVSLALPLGVVTAFFVWLLLWRTALGFEIRAVGQSESAARAAGIDASRVRVIALSLAGGLAGMVGIGEVLGNAGKFVVGFSPDFGFMGIAVALLGRNQPAGVLASALLFGALHPGIHRPGPGNGTCDPRVVVGFAGTNHSVGLRRGHVELDKNPPKEQREAGGQRGGTHIMGPRDD